MTRKRQTREEPRVSKKKLRIINELRLLDDVYMREVLVRNRAGVADILRVITKRQNVKIHRVRTQEVYSNLRGHSVQLDVLAEDENGAFFNVEIQRDSSGASPKRARYHFAAIDWNNFKAGLPYEELTETWVVFITENRVFKSGKPIEVANRFFDDGKPCEEGQTLCYVDARYVGDDELGKLMADFREPNPDKIHFQSLAKRMKWLKKDKKGIVKMSTTLDKFMGKRLKVEREEGEKEGEERGLKKGHKRGLEEGREKARMQMIGALLNANSAETLLNDPRFTPLGCTPADIAAALALQK